MNRYTVDNHILIIVHRWSFLYYTKNTLIYITKDIEENSDYTEIDVRLTKDNKVVLFQDNSFKKW